MSSGSQKLAARVQELEKQLEESQKERVALLQDQQQTDSFFRHRIRAGISRHMPRKRHYRKVHLEETVCSIMPPNVFDRLFPFSQRTTARLRTCAFQTLESLELGTGLSSRLHQKADDACTKTYAATTAMAITDHHADAASHLHVYKNDRLLLRKRRRVDEVDGYEAMASDGSSGFVPDAILSDFQPASLRYRGGKLGCFKLRFTTLL